MEAYDNHRYHMWVKIFKDEYALDYHLYNKDERKMIKFVYASSKGLKPYMIDCLTIQNCSFNTSGSTPAISLDCCKTPAVPQSPYAIKRFSVVQEQEKENAMNANFNATIGSPDAEARTYLLNRLRVVYADHYKAIRETFKLEDDESPKSPKELVDRIKAGKFQFRTDKGSGLNEDGSWKDEDTYHDAPRYYILWRTEPVDQKGFEAADKALDDAKRATEDEIRILPVDKGLESLRKFEAMTF